MATSSPEVVGDDTCASKVARSILLNQQNMKLISEARGARHVLVIQPQFSLHSSARSEFKVRAQEERRCLGAAFLFLDHQLWDWA